MKGNKVTDAYDMKVGYLYFEDTLGFVVTDISDGYLSIQATNKKIGSIMLKDLQDEKEGLANLKEIGPAEDFPEYFL